MEKDVSTRLGCVEDFIAGVKSYYNNPDLSDVIIRVDGRVFHCHKFFLASSSDVFQTMLTGSQWVDSQQQEIVLEESPECTAVFGEFLKYLYCGQVTVDMRTIMPIFTLADKYNIHRLRCQCERYMTEQIGQGNVNGALDWLSFAETYNLDQLVSHCYEVIACNLPKILELDSWLGLSVEQMCRLLDSGQLIVTDEYSLFKAIERWLVHDLQKGGVTGNLRRVLPYIRFAQMTSEHILTIERSEFGQIYEKQIKDHILEGYKFHALVGTANMSELFLAERYHARLYLAPPHCHVLYVHPTSTVMANAMTQGYRPKSGSPWYLLLLQNSKADAAAAAACSASATNDVTCERGMLTNVTYKLQAPNTDIGKSFRLAISAFDANDKFLNAVTKSGLVYKPDGPTANVHWSLTTNVTTIHSQAFLDKKGGKIKLGVVIQVF
ncbi:BTB/POZ domain-containing protein 17-like [Patiria miniata]|uniref:BTB domain-containing protein n=1 Tax=Patiria miniata TaxID=46514 RepID=A0A913ZHM1_PATMI|nr:BTB/POZ domain-containing protein 17-like [Patiria miniata]XP_038050561.1 BTB/POZ domain-containing protein 17-like [Patiria miniata]